MSSPLIEIIWRRQITHMKWAIFYKILINARQSYLWKILSYTYPIKVNNFDIGTDENGELNVKIKVNDLTPEVQNLLSQVWPFK